MPETTHEATRMARIHALYGALGLLQQQQDLVLHYVRDRVSELDALGVLWPPPRTRETTGADT